MERSRTSPILAIIFIPFAQSLVAMVGIAFIRNTIDAELLYSGAAMFIGLAAWQYRRHRRTVAR
jgi:hypothetical protein